jgi:hypothetical protein
MSDNETTRPGILPRSVDVESRPEISASMLKRVGDFVLSADEIRGGYSDDPCADHTWITIFRSANATYSEVQAIRATSGT